VSVSRRGAVGALIAAPLTTPVAGLARTLDVAALRDAALADRQAYALVESLTTEVGARAAGSPNDDKAVQWALARAQALGLSNVRAEPVPLRVWQRGPAMARLTAPHAHPLVMTALGNTVGTGSGGIEAEIAYYADFAALKADSSDKALGRIVFIDQKTERSKDGRGYGQAVIARIAGAVEAARRGAVAVAIRSIGTDRDRIAHTGAMRYDPQVRQIPAFAVSVPDADLIARLIAHTAARSAVKMRFELQAQSGVVAESANVIAEVPGRDLAEEIVLLSAHLDSWDVGQGALDDGAGVGIVLAAAHHIAALKMKPRRTIRVVLFANEENGFDGANAYAERYANVVHQVVSESDFGAGRIWRLRSRVRPDALPAVDDLATLLAPLGIERPTPGTTGANEGTPGPDAGVLMRRHKWPALELTQDGTHYFDVHHTDNDTLDKIDPATLPQNVAAWALAAWWAANTDLRLGPL
jgi:carboxypeptidase Q